MKLAVPNSITVPAFIVRLDGLRFPQTTKVPPLFTVTLPVKVLPANTQTFIPDPMVTFPLPDIDVEQLVQSSPFKGDCSILRQLGEQLINGGVVSMGIAVIVLLTVSAVVDVAQAVFIRFDVD
ncbi:MAG: hypothetical protein R2806_05205 [Saprospiraceae bacterium]